MFFRGCGKVGFDLAQVNLAPILPWQATSKHSVGAALLLTYQRFEAYGFEAFEAFSQNPQALTGNATTRRSAPAFASAGTAKSHPGWMPGRPGHPASKCRTSMTTRACSPTAATSTSRRITT
ncbi:unnamed protein product [Chrysoparadoxa australica]